MLKWSLAFFWAVGLFAPLFAAADGSIDLIVPLRQERFYSLHTFLDECNRKLGTAYDLRTIPDRELTLTPGEKVILLLADKTGVVHTRFEPGKLILSVPDNKDDQVRRQVRARLSRLVGVPLNEWPAGLGLHLPNRFDPDRRTVLLTHGLDSTVSSLQPMRAAFEQKNVQVLTFDFPNDGPIAWSGDRLSQELEDLFKHYPKLRLAIVAHSMGGLVARYALETPGKNPGCVTDIFLLGVPHSGSRLAGLQPWLEMFQEVLPQPQRLLATMTDGLGEAADDLQPGSRFLTTLNAHGRASDVRYFSARGRKSVVNEQQRAALEQELVRICQQRQLSAATRTQILDAVRADELKDGLGDGAVSLASARLKDVQADKVFDLNHMELLTFPESREEDRQVFPWIINALVWGQSDK